MNAHNGPSQVDKGTPNSKRPKSHSEKFERQFAFVDGLNSRKGTGRAKTRSFVTKQHYRKKRFDKAQQGNDGGRQQQDPVTPVVASAVAHAGREVLVRDKQELISRGDGSDATLLEHLGGGRADPFNSYPIPATKDVHELVDHCEFW